MLNFAFESKYQLIFINLYRNDREYIYKRFNKNDISSFYYAGIYNLNFHNFFYHLNSVENK